MRASTVSRMEIEPFLANIATATTRPNSQHGLPALTGPETHAAAASRRHADGHHGSVATHRIRRALQRSRLCRRLPFGLTPPAVVPQPSGIASLSAEVATGQV